jgi:hypothetical protein
MQSLRSNALEPTASDLAGLGLYSASPASSPSTAF